MRRLALAKFLLAINPLLPSDQVHSAYNQFFKGQDRLGPGKPRHPGDPVRITFVQSFWIFVDRLGVSINSKQLTSAWKTPSSLFLDERNVQNDRVDASRLCTGFGKVSVALGKACDADGIARTNRIWFSLLWIFTSKRNEEIGLRCEKRSFILAQSL